MQLAILVFVTFIISLKKTPSMVVLYGFNQNKKMYSEELIIFFFTLTVFTSDDVINEK